MIRKLKDKIKSCLRNQLIFALVCSTTVLLLLFTLFTYKVISADSSAKYIEANSTQLNYLETSLNSYLETLEKPILLLYTDIIMSPEYFTNKSKDVNAYNYIMKKLQGLYSQQSEVYSIQFYSIQQDETYIVNSFTNYSAHGDYEITKQDWYQTAMAQKQIVILPSHETESYHSNATTVNEKSETVFSLVRSIYDGAKPIGILLINYKTSYLENFLKENPPGQSVIYFVNNSNEVLASSAASPNASLDNDIFQEIQGSPEIKGSNKTLSLSSHQDNLVLYTALHKYPLILVKTIPSNIILRQARNIRNLLLISSIILLIIMVITIIGVSYRITSRLTILKSEMEFVAKGNFDVDIQINGCDEVAKISKTFAYMVSHIHSLINEKYIMNLEFQKAKLKALNAQINPHFLYNTLQAIGSVAHREGLEEIVQMTKSLSDMMRYSIKSNNSANENLSTIKDECKNIDDYLKLQAFRFEDKLLYHISMPPETENIVLPKLTLEPLVENAIVHGLEPLKTQGFILVKILLTDNRCNITVTDNGIGFSPDVLQSLNNLSSRDEATVEGDSIGIINVYHRLSILYADNFKMSLSSIPYRKTIITISLNISGEV